MKGYQTMDYTPQTQAPEQPEFILTPEDSARMKALLFGTEPNYIGTDTLTPLRAELALKDEAIRLLRDALCEAEQELTILREELSAARMGGAE